MGNVFHFTVFPHTSGDVVVDLLVDRFKRVACTAFWGFLKYVVKMVAIGFLYFLLMLSFINRIYKCKCCGYYDYGSHLPIQTKHTSVDDRVSTHAY